MIANNVENVIEVLFSSARRDVVAEHNLSSVVVGLGIELDLAFEKSLLAAHCPTAETACHFHDVLLSVAALHAEGVKLEKFAGVVFVRLFLVVAFFVLPSVEIPKHGGTESRGSDEIRETSHGVLANDLAIVGGLEPAAVFLGGVDVKMIAPKMSHHFEELFLAPGGANESGAGELFEEEFLFVFIHLSERLSEDFETSGRAIGAFVVNAVGVELFFEVGLCSGFLGAGESFDAGVVAWGWSEASAIERVGDEINAVAGWGNAGTVLWPIEKFLDPIAPRGGKESQAGGSPKEGTA